MSDYILKFKCKGEEKEKGFLYADIRARNNKEAIEKAKEEVKKENWICATLFASEIKEKKIWRNK